MRAVGLPGPSAAATAQLRSVGSPSTSTVQTCNPGYSQSFASPQLWSTSHSAAATQQQSNTMIGAWSLQLRVQGQRMLRCCSTLSWQPCTTRGTTSGSPSSRGHSCIFTSQTSPYNQAGYILRGHQQQAPLTSPCLAQHLPGTLLVRTATRSMSTSAAASSNTDPQSKSTTSSQPAAPRPTYSPLHYNIEEFVQKIVPTEGERRIKAEIVEDLKVCVRKTFPTYRGVEVQVFGSFANGLSCWNSDLDIVVTGLMEPDKGLGGYEPGDRAKVTARLRRIADSLRHARKVDATRIQFIPRARIPILKLYTRSRVCVDISISDDSGPRAARYMAQQSRAYPPLRPLVLVLKTFLKVQRLNEVNSGGLSSYSLTNMVIAHLQEELKAGHDIYDLGETLYTFLLRYGEEFNYETEAVSVASGGIVRKSSLGFAMESARQAAASMGSYEGAVGWQERLCVDCPLSGRDVSNGTFRIDLVRQAWVAAARKLEALARGRRITDTSINYLQALFDVSRVLRRTSPTDAYESNEYYTVVPGDDDEGVDIIGGPLDSRETEEYGIISDIDSDYNYGADDASDVMNRQPTTTTTTTPNKGNYNNNSRRGKR